MSASDRKPLDPYGGARPKAEATEADVTISWVWASGQTTPCPPMRWPSPRPSRDRARPSCGTPPRFGLHRRHARRGEVRRRFPHHWKRSRRRVRRGQSLATRRSNPVSEQAQPGGQLKVATRPYAPTARPHCAPLREGSQLLPASIVQRDALGVIVSRPISCIP